jgi:rhodanese-related sulfurtransferase
MAWIAAALLVLALIGLLAFLRKRARERRFLAAHTITPAELNDLRSSGQDFILYDGRLSLELLAYSEIIPGSIRIDPDNIEQIAPTLPRDRDLVVYCTCIADDTSRKIVLSALSHNFTRIKLLKGGLTAWKASGFPVEPYTTPFHLRPRTVST